jgi:hypothetical protein
VLARHFSEALQPEPAWGYWLEAGRRAAERPANVEAIGHLRRALQTLELLPESAELDRQELTIRNTIGTPLIGVHGYASPGSRGGLPSSPRSLWAARRRP